MLVPLTALQELEVVTGTGSLLAEATRMASMTFRVSASYVLLFTLTLDVGLRILSNKYLYLKGKNMVLYTQGFLTPDSFHSTSFTTWGSNWASKEAKFIKEFNFLGFSRCFSARIEQTSKNHPKMTQFG